MQRALSRGSRCSANSKQHLRTTSCSRCDVTPQCHRDVLAAHCHHAIIALAQKSSSDLKLVYRHHHTSNYYYSCHSHTASRTCQSLPSWALANPYNIPYTTAQQTQPHPTCPFSLPSRTVLKSTYCYSCHLHTASPVCHSNPSCILANPL
jgi:hypothetical protein